MTSSLVTSRDVSPAGSAAEGPRGRAVLSGRQQAAEAAHRRAREQKQVRDDCPSEALHIFFSLAPIFLLHSKKCAFFFCTLHNVADIKLKLKYI